MLKLVTYLDDASSIMLMLIHASLLQVRIAMVGKYTGLSDAYLSVLKALQHACLAVNRKLEVHWVDASHLEPTTQA